MFGFRIAILFFIVVITSSCDIELIPTKEEKIIAPKTNCIQCFNFNKKLYSVKDPELIQLISKIDSIDMIINSKKVKTTEKNVNKFSSFIVYSKNNQNLKLISDIYIRKINLSATKHEIYFIDKCNIVAKMTKYAYRSTRVKSIFYFLFYNNQYKGCIASHHHSIFHKKDKWMNISNEILAINWSSRIYNNIIKSHLND